MRWSPNDSVASHQDANAASATLEAANSELLALRRAIELEVSTAQQELVAAQQQLVPARQNVALVERNYRGHEELFRAGRISARELAIIATDLRHARLAWVEVAVGARVAEAHLRYACGALLHDGQR